jgi:hypothetical protein
LLLNFHDPLALKTEVRVFQKLGEYERDGVYPTEYYNTKNMQ